jgi:predicted secreted protein
MNTSLLMPEAQTAGLRGQLLVMASLLEETLRVVKNVEAEGCDEGELLQALISKAEAAIAAVLTEQHAVPVAGARS